MFQELLEGYRKTNTKRAILARTQAPGSSLADDLARDYLS